MTVAVSHEFESVERLPAFQALKTQIANELRALVALAEPLDAERSSAIRRAANDLDALAFNVAVIGEFNRGKTTFVNALLGRSDLLAAAPLPNTATITRISATEAGAQEYFRVVFRDPAHATLTGLDLKDLDRYVSDATTSKSGAGPGNAVERVELFLDSDFLRRNGIVLIDTPGLGAISKAHQDVTERLIPTVHAALFVFMLDPPLGATEIAFLQFSMAYVQRFLFVMNDKHNVLLHNPTDAADVIAYAKRELAAVGVEAPIIVGLNPGGYLRGTDSGFDTFWPILAEFLIAGRGRALLTDALHKAAQHVSTLRASLDHRLLDLEQQTSVLRAEQRQIQARAAELQTRQSALQNQVDVELNEIVALILADVDGLAVQIDRDVSNAIDSFGIGALRTIQVQLPEIIQQTVNRWIQDKRVWVNGRCERLFRRVTDALRELSADYHAADLMASAADPMNIPVGMAGVDLGGDVALALATGLGIAAGVALLDVLTSGGVGALSVIVGSAAGGGTAGAMLLQRVRTSLKQTLHKPLAAPNESQTPLSALIEGYIDADGQEVHGLRARIADEFAASEAAMNAHIATAIREAWQPRFQEIETELVRRGNKDSDLTTQRISLLATMGRLDELDIAFQELAKAVLML